MIYKTCHSNDIPNFLYFLLRKENKSKYVKILKMWKLKSAYISESVSFRVKSVIIKNQDLQNALFHVEFQGPIVKEKVAVGL